MRQRWFRICFAAAATIALCACHGGRRAESKPIDPTRLKAFAPLPAAVASAGNPITDEKVSLGRMLYYDARLSRGQDVSCNSCHPLNNYGADGQPTSEGYLHA